MKIMGNIGYKIGVILLLSCVLYIYIANIGVVRSYVEQPKGNMPVGEIVKGMRVEQTFWSDKSNISGFSVKLGTYARINQSTITFILQEDSGKVIYKNTVKADGLSDNAYYKVRFPPVKNSKNKEYHLILETKDASPGNAITAYSSQEDIYKGGILLIDGKKSSADLVFEIVFNDTFLQRSLFFL
ncbi:hypothetical protein ACTHPH_18055 [Paenibacillus pasadenensis]|uniref:hypothetical protein n=1 Tax=Paenibacillus pasadenensis TaxID=217090 RepID=UPI000FDAA829|nr:hypothetical protein [Paenibacillus pasadenensis]